MALACRFVDPEETENRVVSWWANDRALGANWPLTTHISHDMAGFFPEIEVTDPDALFEREKAAFNALSSTLRRWHTGRYVAVHDGQVAVVGDSEAEVVKEFFERHGDTSVYVGYVGDEEPPTYQISPFGF
jgi:hypothetical protein